MSKSKYKSLIFLLSAIAVICVILLATNSFAPPFDTDAKVKSAPRPASEYLDAYYANLDDIICPIGIGAWDIYTAFPQSYRVSSQDDVLYFGRYDDDDRYSANATLTTPYLTLNNSHQVYTLSFEYFSPRTIELANNITVYASKDGQSFSKIGEVGKVYNSHENNFVSASFKVQSQVQFLRLELKIYQSSDTSHGIYLKNFSLTPQTPSGETTPGFTVQMGNLDLGYTGYGQVPSYNIDCADSSYQYKVAEMVLDSSYKLCDSVDLGSYMLIVLIYNFDNELVHIAESSFTISKGAITRAQVDYFATADGIVINHVSLYTSGGLVTANLGNISYTSPSGNKTSVTVQESSHFTAFQSGEIALDINAEYLINTANPIKTYTYNGQAQEVSFTNTTGKESVVKYYHYGKEMESAPIDVGEYTAEIYIAESLVKTLSMTIKPDKITAIYATEATFNRVYDGTTNVYNAQPEHFVFNTANGIVDDSSLKVENVYTAAKIGQSYLVFDKATFGGNYVLDDAAIVEKIVASIDKVDIKLQGNTYDGSPVITVLDKQYDGQTNAIIDIDQIVTRYGSVENAPLTFLGVPYDESLYVDALTATFESVYASQNIPIGIRITDLTYWDRFNAEIYAKDLIFGTIYAKKVSVLPSSDIQVLTKPYDATLKASVVINSVEFGSDIVSGDQEIMANNQNFEISYAGADYANANAGNKSVSVSGLALHSKNPTVSKIVNSYEINDITLDGKIVPKTINVIDEYIHVIAGQSVPSITASGADVELYISYYATRSDAENKVEQIDGFDTATAGNYYIRAEMPFNQINYKLESGYEIIPLEITSQKKAQTLTFDIDAFEQENQEYGAYYKIAIGGRFTPQAVSVSTHLGENCLTGLPITYEGNTGTKLTFSQGVYTAREVGLVTITAKQNGNASYLAATPVTIQILIVDDSVLASDDIAVSGGSALYYGDNLPDITGSALFGDNQVQVQGEFVKKEGSLTTGDSEYLYDFVPREKYLGHYSDISVPLTTQKATLSVKINHATKDYYSDIDLLDFAQITLVKGDRQSQIAVSQYPALNLSFTFSHDIQRLEYKATPYNIGFSDSSTYYFTAQENANYDIEYQTATFDLVVNLREITVSVVDFAREYGFADYEIALDIKNCDEQDKALILDSITIIEQVQGDSDVGRYALILSVAGGDFDNKYTINIVNGFMDITKAKITFTASNLSSVYLEALSTPIFTVTGFHIDSDQDYYSRYVELTHSVTSASSVGTYPIKIECAKLSSNYDFSFVYGAYTVTPATLTGITFPDGNFVYDGQRRSIGIRYDKQVWGELAVAYSDYDISAIGRYPITAVVSKENYHNLALHATLTISPLSLTSSGKQTTATITMLGADLVGFDPRSTLMLVQNNNQKTLDRYSEMLVVSDDIAEEILGVYNFFLTIDGVKTEIESSNEVKIKLAEVGSTSRIRVFANVDGKIVELAHAYKDGYIVFETPATEFAIVKSASAFTKDRTSLIIGIGVGIVMLVVFYIAFFGYGGQSKRQRKRLIRKYKRWA